MPTAAPWADVACRASPDGRPHRPQSKSGHRSRRSGKPTGSVCRSSPLPSCVLQLAPLSPAQAATTTHGRPQLRPQDWIRSQTPGSPPVVGARHPPRPHFARSSSAGHRWSAARDTTWLTLITSSGRHIMRRSVRQAPSAASTRPPRRTAARCALSAGRSGCVCNEVGRGLGIRDVPHGLDEWWPVPGDRGAMLDAVARSAA